MPEAKEEILRLHIDVAGYKAGFITLEHGLVELVPTNERYVETVVDHGIIAFRGSDKSMLCLAANIYDMTNRIEADVKLEPAASMLYYLQRYGYSALPAIAPNKSKPLYDLFCKKVLITPVMLLKELHRVKAATSAAQQVRQGKADQS